jgi:RHS repeat-associated protein
MLLNGVEYAYLRNAQNDIVGLIDVTGTQVVSYTYSTWGEVLSVTGSLAGTLGAKNPYRYRGYRLDSETGLYYLQSRYYNHQWGRFLNADKVVAGIGSSIGYSMFTYCGNNPINLADPSGYWPKWIRDIANDISNWASNTFGSQSRIITTIDYGKPKGIDVGIVKVISGTTRTINTSVGENKSITSYSQTSDGKPSIGMECNLGKLSSEVNFSLGSQSSTLTLNNGTTNHSISANESFFYTSFTFTSSVVLGNISDNKYTTITVNKLALAFSLIGGAQAGPAIGWVLNQLSGQLEMLK